MFFKKKQSQQIYAPVAGTCIPLQEVNDSTFSDGLMGPGIGIEPADTIIKSPVSGKITMIFPTGHAIGLTRDDGLEVLIHVGIETVNLQGKGFQVLCEQNQTIKTGTELLRVDFAYIRQQGLDPTVIMVFPNGKEFHVEFVEDARKVSNEDVIVNVKK